MKSTVNYYSHKDELSTEILFIKEELNFLLKILRNGYSTSIKLETIKRLDSFWNGFEQNIKELNLLSGKVTEKESSDENGIISEFNKINKNIKALKKSFYEFMQGCSVCALKANQLNYESSCF